MSEDQLTPVQRYVLVVLMMRARAVPQTEIVKSGISLRPAARNALKDLGLISVTEKPITLELTEKGWGRAIVELAAEAPPRSGSAGGALYVSLHVIRQLLEHTGMAPAELFTLQTRPAAAIPDLETRIREAYAGVAPRVGDYVMLAVLRQVLDGAPKADVDAALIRLDRAPDVHLVPESNQKILTPEERAAAVSIGNQDKHLIAIGS